MSKTSIKKGQHGGSLRLPAYAYVVRISGANLCDIGTSCNTIYNNFGHIASPIWLCHIICRNTLIRFFLCRRLWRNWNRRERRKGKQFAFFWYNRHILSFILSVFQPDIERIVYAVALLHPCWYTFQRVDACSVTLRGCDNSQLVHLVKHTGYGLFVIAQLLDKSTSERMACPTCKVVEKPLMAYFVSFNTAASISRCKIFMRSMPYLLPAKYESCSDESTIQ